MPRLCGIAFFVTRRHVYALSSRNLVRFFILYRTNKYQIKLARPPPLQILKKENSKFGGKENEWI